MKRKLLAILLVLVLILAQIPASYAADDPVELDTQILVVGGGIAGLSAAVEGASQGGQVILIEKMGYLGGTGNLAEGPFAIGTDLARELAGVDYEPMDILQDVMNYTHYKADGSIWIDLIENSAEDIEWLQDMGVKFFNVASKPGMPKVHHDIDGRGAAAVQCLQQRCEELGVTVMLNTKGTDLIMDGDKVIGAYAEADDGTKYEIRADGTVLACGGIISSEEQMRARGFQYDRLDLLATPGHDGDGLRMAYSAGAAQGDIILMMLGPALIGSARELDIDLASTTEPCLWVNQYGVRFCNEDVQKNPSMAGNAVLSQQHVYTVYDRDYFDNMISGTGLVQGVTNRPGGTLMTELDAQVEQALEDNWTNVYKADTLEELAEKMGIDPEQFAETVEDYNAMCEAGNDSLFGKDPIYMKPVSSAPYYAFEVGVNVYATMGGIKVNRLNQVLRDDWTAIDGLFCIGTDCNALDGDTYSVNMPGAAMAYCIYSGRNAARVILGVE